MGVMFKEFNCFVIEIQNKQNNGRWKGIGNGEEVLKIKNKNKRK
jgi:predicted secreted protein